MSLQSRSITWYFRFFVLLIAITGFLPLKAQAQEAPSKTVSVGYFGPLPFEPGLRIGMPIPIKTFEKSALLIQPHVGFFNKKNDNFNLIAGTEIGWKLQAQESKNSHVFSLGTAYLFQNEVTEFTVNLQGEITDLKRSPRHIFMPTINYEYARYINPRLAPFVKLGYGYKMSGVIENSGSFLGELGVQIKW